MLTEIDTEQTLADPLGASLHFPLSAAVYPLGFPVRIETNSPAVIRAARESWSKFTKTFDKPAVRMSIGVADDTGSTLPAAPLFRSREHLLSIVSDPENFVVCDLAQGFGFGWVTRAVVADPAFFRYYFLDAAALTMLDQLYLTPVHGGLIEREGCGILLCGESFAGKSTLAYACARSGWKLVSDDGTFLLRGWDDRFGIGNPHALRFREDARFLFPELRSQLTARRANGKAGIEVETSGLPGIATSPGCLIEHVVFLNRHAGGTARLSSISPSEALARIDCATHYGLAKVREERRACYLRLVAGGAWQLNYGDLNSAVSRLNNLAEGSR